MPRDLFEGMDVSQQQSSGPRDLFAESGMTSAPQIAAAPMSRTDKFAMGLADPIHGGAQLMTKLLPDSVVSAGNTLNNWIADKTGLVARLPEGGVDQAVRERDAAYQARRAAAGESGFDGWRLSGNVLNPANTALAARGIAALGTGAKLLQGAKIGALSSTLAPVANGDFAEEKAKQAAIGAAFGAAVPAAGAVIGRLISPKASMNADVALLKSEGVSPTIGQTLGGRMNALEERLSSLPVIGDAISAARGKALDQFNQAAINRATGKVGVAVDEVGHQGVSRAQQAISQAYDDALGQIKAVKLDGQFAGELGRLHQMTRALTPPMRAKFDATMGNVLGGRAGTTGTLTAETFKKVDSELGNLAGKYSGSAVASEKELGDALLQARELLKQQAIRSNPKAAEALSQADAAYAALVRVENAANRGVNAEGVFTPGQLNMAVRQADGSARHRATAGGKALMQDLAKAGQSVLGNKVPNSFTTDRALIATGALGGAGMLNPAAAAGLLGGAAMYSRPIQGLLTRAITTRPQAAQAVSNSLLQASPGLVPFGAQVGIGLLNNP